MYCMNCGKEMDEKATFCENCGAQVKQPAAGNAYPGNGRRVGDYGVSDPLAGADNKQKETKKTKEKKQKVRKKKDPKRTLIISLILFAVVVIGGVALGTFLYVRKKQQATISYKLNAMRED